MRVLVTGGAGFLGSHVVDLLLSQGHHVTVVDNLSTGSTSNLHAGTHFYDWDVQYALDDIFLKAQPQVVVHLAAQVSVASSITHPDADLRSNVNGTVNVMTAAAKAAVTKVIAVSSSAVYGVPDQMPITEASPTAAISPYGLSKLVSEHYMRLLGSMYQLPYLILRPANIYGPRQTAQGEGAVIPAFLSRFVQGQDPVIHGDGSQTRDFIYVTDVAQAIVSGFERAAGYTLNIGTGVGTSILELWLQLAHGMAWERAPVFGAERTGDIPRSIIANGLARQQLGWAPQVSLAEGLAETRRAYFGMEWRHRVS